MCVNDPEIVTLWKLSNPSGFFGLKIFNGLAILGGRIERNFFGHKNVGKSVRKTILKMANSSKNIQKTLKCSNGNTPKEANIIS